ncbi:hypothetical protein Ahy_B06g081129 [Arachis hypogaea]|uniref:Uncharacterized protein n=1 Tax=Arachis hypogaea TaxID=3818 RepID=A0A444YK84_ARAHY|nr:hypothetical protein Ahy_B06g081129 [Arachis hypogaea]
MSIENGKSLASLARKRFSRSKWYFKIARTIVNHVQNPSFPLVAWHLKSIVELLTVEKVDDFELFDLIAEVVEKKDPRDLITSKRMKTKDFMESSILCVGVQQNVRNNRINCILFGDIVDLILSHVEDGRVEPLIVSHFYVSKLHFDPEIKEVAGFRSRMLCGTSSSFSRISQVFLQDRWLGVEDLNQGSVVAKTIIEEGLVWIAATIVSINASKSNWYYKPYRRCPKKVDTPIGKRYECTKYGHTWMCRSMTLLLWDRKTTQLARKIAKKVMDEENTPTLDNIMDKMALFKINDRAANIKQYDQNYMKNGCRNSVDMSGHVVNLKTDIDPHFSMDDLKDNVSSGKFKISAKSAFSGINDAAKSLSQNEEEGQFSTNRFSRKARKK